jgi:RimJ/RimL family protein N-acetyltransferase
VKPIFLEGKNILLHPLSNEDKFGAYARWINDQETTLYMGAGKFPTSINELMQYIENYKKRKDGMLLGIFLKKSSKHIGNITLHQINWKVRHAEIGILLGDIKSRGNGYATEARRRHAI